MWEHARRWGGGTRPDPAAGSMICFLDMIAHFLFQLFFQFRFQLRPSDLIFTTSSRGRALDFIYTNFLREAAAARVGRSGQKCRSSKRDIEFRFASFIRKNMIH